MSKTPPSQQGSSENFDFENSQKLDFLYKKLGGLLGKTDNEVNKSLNNEKIYSPLTVTSDTIYYQKIPKPAPTVVFNEETGEWMVDSFASSKIVKYYYDYELTEDLTSTDKRTWLAREGLNDHNSNLLMDWIPPVFDECYLIEVRIGVDENNLTRIFPDGSGKNDEWFFDYKAGILNFNGLDLPEGIEDSRVFIRGYRFIGQTNTDKINELEDIIKRLIPQGPPSFPSNPLVFETEFAIGTPKLADENSSGEKVPDYTDSEILPGDEIIRRVETILSNIIDYSGSSDSGEFTSITSRFNAYRNDELIDSINFTDGDNSGSFIVSEILEDVDYSLVDEKCVEPNLFEAFTSRVNETEEDLLEAGIHGYKLDVEGYFKDGSFAELLTTGEKYLVFDKNNLLEPKAIITPDSFQIDDVGNLDFSSGVPHIESGAKFNFEAVLDHLTFETYRDDTNNEDKPFILYTEGNTEDSILLPTAYYTFLDLGEGQTFPDTIENNIIGPSGFPRRNFDSITTNLSYEANPLNSHGIARLSYITNNINANGEAIPYDLLNFIVMNGLDETKIDEDNIKLNTIGDNICSNLLVGSRINMGSDNVQFTSDVYTSLDLALQSYDIIKNGPLPNYEAVVAGGLLSHNQIDYSLFYYPPGPNYNVPQRTGAQYFTMVISSKAISQFMIKLSGKLQSIYIKLPGVSEEYTTPEFNGWWDMSKEYAGYGIPGNVENTNYSLGCSQGHKLNTNGSNIKPGVLYDNDLFLSTFGPQSSTNSVDNMIYIRIKLNPGDYISNLELGRIDDFI